MKNLILIGGGGHASSCLEIIEQYKNYKIIGIIEKKKDFNNIDYTYLGDDKSLKDLKEKYSYAAICIGQIKSHIPRLNIYNKLINLKFNLPNFISKNTILSSKSTLGISNFIMSNVFLNRNVNVGNNNIINTGSIIEHDSTIGNNCHISTGSIINGNVTIEDNVFIGSGSVVYHNTTIKKNSIIPAGTIIR